jgi:hypothetical protein
MPERIPALCQMFVAFDHCRPRSTHTLCMVTSPVAEALDLVAAQGDRHREAALRNNLADTLHRAGRDDEAMEELKRAVAIFAEVGGHEDEPQPGVWRLVEW